MAAGCVGGSTVLATPCVATGGSARFATTVRLCTPSTLMWTVSAVAGWSASVARPVTRTDCALVRLPREVELAWRGCWRAAEAAASAA